MNTQPETQVAPAQKVVGQISSVDKAALTGLASQFNVAQNNMTSYIGRLITQSGFSIQTHGVSGDWENIVELPAQPTSETTQQ